VVEKRGGWFGGGVGGVNQEKWRACRLGLTVGLWKKFTEGLGKRRLTSDWLCHSILALKARCLYKGGRGTITMHTIKSGGVVEHQQDRLRGGSFGMFGAGETNLKGASMTA